VLNEGQFARYFVVIDITRCVPMAKVGHSGEYHLHCTVSPSNHRKKHRLGRSERVDGTLLGGNSCLTLFWSLDIQQTLHMWMAHCRVATVA